MANISSVPTSRTHSLARANDGIGRSHAHGIEAIQSLLDLVCTETKTKKGPFRAEADGSKFTLYVQSARKPGFSPEFRMTVSLPGVRKAHRLGSSHASILRNWNELAQQTHMSGNQAEKGGIHSHPTKTEEIQAQIEYAETMQDAWSTVLQDAIDIYQQYHPTSSETSESLFAQRASAKEGLRDGIGQTIKAMSRLHETLSTMPMLHIQKVPRHPLPRNVADMLVDENNDVGICG